MSGMRSAAIAGVLTVTLALACLAGGASRSSASTKTATAAPLVTAFATTMLETVIGGVKDEAISAGFGSLLDFIGLNDEPAATAEQVSQLDARVQRVEEALAQTNVTVTDIKRNVDATRLDVNLIKDKTLQTSYDIAAQAAAPIVADIDTALRKIKAANQATKQDRASERTRDDAESYIGSFIDGDAERLRDIVFGDSRGIGATSLIQAAYDLAAGNYLVTHDESVHVRYLADFYSTYESLAAAITAEYRHARAGYDKADVDSYLSGWVSTIQQQLDNRRQTVPAGTVVDARSLKMWALAPLTTRSPASRDKISGPGGYSDWAIPSVSRYQTLYAGYLTTPKAFLQNHGFDVSKGNVVITNQTASGHSACQPGFQSIDLNGNPPPIGTLYGADLGGCPPGNHNGQTTWKECKQVAKGGRGGGSTTKCVTYTDQQQVRYNNRKFGSGHLFYAVRSVPVGSFLPANFVGEQ